MSTAGYSSRSLTTRSGYLGADRTAGRGNRPAEYALRGRGPAGENCWNFTRKLLTATLQNQVGGVPIRGDKLSRGSPGIALGDVIGANVTICLVALGVGAVIAPLPFRAAVMRYALLGLPLGAIGASFAWDGLVSRWEGAILVALYVLYVAAIWRAERKPPALGEVGLAKPVKRRPPGAPRWLDAIWRSCWPGSWPWRVGPRCL